ncbi:MAG: phosphoribosylformylglycinamidine synthase subunit PurL [Vulcanimicrobiaceae bacterium]
MAASAGTLRVSGLADDVALAAELRAHGIALKPSEARRIAERLGRDPTLVEAHAFDAQWSEHCSYKSSRHYLSRLPTEGPTVMQGPQEDAGVVHLGSWEGRRYGIAIAHESHNHPSQVVPFEGAATGIGGIVRDVLCMGARVIAIADPLRFGPQDDPHCRYVAQGVVDGIAAYGNAIGVPNIAGDAYFHEGFRDNCLVNVVALGLLEESELIHSAAPPEAEGWDIVLVGKATDRSGFGGAAFSSLVLDEDDAEQNKSAVQVPDPFLKNVVMRASYRVFDVLKARGLRVGFKDLGAGGIMGCTAEIVASGGFGAIVDLDRCPTSQEHLPPAVIAVGETQERLTWVVPPTFTSELLAIYNDEYSLPQIARGARAAVIGTVTKQREYVLRYRGEEAMRVDIDFLTGGIRYDRAVQMPTTETDESPTTNQRDAAARDALFPQPLPAHGLGEAELFARVLAHRDVCSRAPLFERFDSVVRGTTAIPAGYADAGVVVPIPGAPLAVALAVDGNPRYACVDVRRASELAVCEAVRNVAAVGARPAGLTDCLNFGNPEIPAQMGEFVAAVDGIAHAARELGVPFVSGNVSLYNTSANGSAVPGSPIIACVGAIEDISRTATHRLKAAGHALVFLGLAQRALGGSVYAEIAGLVDRLPQPNYEHLRREIATLLVAYDRGLVAAAHDVSDGGLLVSLAEMAFANLALGLAPVGVRLDATAAWTHASGPAEIDVFAEYGGFVIETTDLDALLEIARDHDVAACRVGSTTADAAIETHQAPEAPTRHDLDAIYALWRAPLRDFYASAEDVR